MIYESLKACSRCIVYRLKVIVEEYQAGYVPKQYWVQLNQQTKKNSNTTVRQEEKNDSLPSNLQEEITPSSSSETSSKSQTVSSSSSSSSPSLTSVEANSEKNAEGVENQDVKPKTESADVFSIACLYVSEKSHSTQSRIIVWSGNTKERESPLLIIPTDAIINQKPQRMDFLVMQISVNKLSASNMTSLRNLIPTDEQQEEQRKIGHFLRGSATSNDNTEGREEDSLFFGIQFRNNDELLHFSSSLTEALKAKTKHHFNRVMGELQFTAISSRIPTKTSKPLPPKPRSLSLKDNSFEQQQNQHTQVNIKSNQNHEVPNPRKTSLPPSTTTTTASTNVNSTSLPVLNRPAVPPKRRSASLFHASPSQYIVTQGSKTPYHTTNHHSSSSSKLIVQDTNTSISQTSKQQQQHGTAVASLVTVHGPAVPSTIIPKSASTVLLKEHAKHMVEAHQKQIEFYQREKQYWATLFETIQQQEGQ